MSGGLCPRNISGSPSRHADRRTRHPPGTRTLASTSQLRPSDRPAASAPRHFPSSLSLALTTARNAGGPPWTTRRAPRATSAGLGLTKTKPAPQPPSSTPTLLHAGHAQREGPALDDDRDGQPKPTRTTDGLSTMTGWGNVCCCSSVGFPERLPGVVGGGRRSTPSATEGQSDPTSWVPALVRLSGDIKTTAKTRSMGFPGFPGFRQPRLPCPRVSSPRPDSA